MVWKVNVLKLLSRLSFPNQVDCIVNRFCWNSTLKKKTFQKRYMKLHVTPLSNTRFKHSLQVRHTLLKNTRQVCKSRKTIAPIPNDATSAKSIALINTSTKAEKVGKLNPQKWSKGYTMRTYRWTWRRSNFRSQYFSHA